MGSSGSKNFSNWSENLNVKQKIAYPKSDEDIINIIKRAKRNRECVRVVGAGHSIPPCVCGPKDKKIKLISLSKYCLYPDNITINHEKMIVTVCAGYSLSQLYQELNKYRYFLDTQPASAAFNIAGLVCTPVHGARLGASHLADSLVAIRLIDENSEIVIKTHMDPDFSYYQLSMGAFGIITSCSFKIRKCENFIMKTLTFPVLSDLFDTFIKHCISKCLSNSEDEEPVEYAQCFFDLHANKVLCLHWLEEKIDSREIKKYVEPKSVHKHFFLEQFLRTVDDNYRESPWTLSVLNKLARRTIIQNVHHDFSTNRDMFWLSSAVRAYFMEYYIPIYSEYEQNVQHICKESIVDYDDNSSSKSIDSTNLANTKISLDAFYKSINVVVKAHKRFKKANKLFQPDLPCEFRFCLSSSCALSPIYSPTKIVYLAIEVPCLANSLTLEKTDSQLNSDFFEFYSQIENGWRALGGKPHWGKAFGFYSELQIGKTEIFSDTKIFDRKTKMLIQNLASPVFMNDFIKRLIETD